MVTAKDDCQVLTDALLSFAEKMLAKHREFHPFGGVMELNGQVRLVSGLTGEDQSPSTDLMDLLDESFRKGAKEGKYKATSLAYDIRTIPPGKKEKQDAIAINLDHRDGYSAIVVVPYSITADGQVDIEAPFAVKGGGRIFTSP